MEKFEKAEKDECIKMEIDKMVHSKSSHTGRHHK
jgi:hypothetical protein